MPRVTNGNATGWGEMGLQAIIEERRRYSYFLLHFSNALGYDVAMHDMVRTAQHTSMALSLWPVSLAFALWPSRTYQNDC